ncbi:MAG: polysaccharide pyruvyl transferase CsaB [Acetobacteraceae bacterium]|nr:polysaccharide pyruvyl transferase CsaB [Acetobacteraceae bacterium]
MARVVLSGYYGFHNAGDEAMLRAILDALESRIPRLSVTVLSADPFHTRREHGVDAIGRMDLARIYSRLRQADLFISGGGSLLQDVTSDRTLAYYLGLLSLARSLGRRTMVYGQGIGPLRSTVGRALARWVLDRVGLITVRDEASVQELVGLGVTRPRVVLAADPVLGLNLPRGPEEGARILAEEGVGADGRPLVGVALRPWPNARGFERVLAAAVDHLTQALGVEAVFLCLQLPQDLEVSKRVAALLRRPARVLHRRYGPHQIMSILSRLELVVGVRLHALVFAAMMNVPFLGLAYDPKIDGFLHSLGMEPAASLESLRLEDLLFRLEQAWRGRAALRRRLKAAVPGLRALSLKSADLAAEMLGFGAAAGSSEGAAGEAPGGAEGAAGEGPGEAAGGAVERRAGAAGSG